MKSLILVISIFGATAWVGGDALLAEEPYVQWVKTPCGSAGSGDRGLTSDANGGVIALNGYDAALVHLNAQGGTISSNQQPAGAWLQVADVDQAGHQYWIGGVFTNGTFDFPQVRGFFVAKVNPSGQVVWVRNNEVPEVYDGDYYQRIETQGDAKADNAGNVVISGTTIGPFKMQSLEWDGPRLPFVCKLDPNGNVLWGRKVACTLADPSNHSFAGTTAVDLAGNIFVSGWIPAGTADFGGITVYPGANWNGFGGSPLGGDRRMAWGTSSWPSTLPTGSCFG